jgi:hypothetical protein
MFVLDNICKECNHVCNAIYFQLNIDNWTSGNNDIDKFIQDTQLSAHHDNAEMALEWIPYDRFCNIKYITKNMFGEIYKANWIDGCIDKWDYKNKNWKRKDHNMFVNLKCLDYSLELTTEV